MKVEKRAKEEGLHIKYVGGEAWWVDGVVLFVASAIALIAACAFVAGGFSADEVSQAMVWLSGPWFLGLYFLCRKLRKVAEGGFEIVLNFGIVPTYAAALFVMICFFQLAKFWH